MGDLGIAKASPRHHRAETRFRQREHPFQMNVLGSGRQYPAEMETGRTSNPYSEELPHLLKERGLSLRAFADQVGVNQSHLSRLIGDDRRQVGPTWRRSSPISRER